MELTTPRRPSPPPTHNWSKIQVQGWRILCIGGIYGLRFKPVVVEEPWSLDSSNQWGETHLSLATDRDLRYAP